MIYYLKEGSREITRDGDGARKSGAVITTGLKGQREVVVTRTQESNGEALLEKSGDLPWRDWARARQFWK